MTAREERPDLGPVREAELTLTDADTLAAWSACIDAALILLNTAALLVLLVVGRIVWQGISTVVGL